MQKIFSTRLDEATIDELDRVTRRLGMSKRQFLEEAIQLHTRQLTGQGEADVWSETLGAWCRSERPEATVRRARRAFERGFVRHHQAGHARVRR